MVCEPGRRAKETFQDILASDPLGTTTVRGAVEAVSKRACQDADGSGADNMKSETCALKRTGISRVV